MKQFLMKYNANKLETSKDEGMLTLETARERILKLLNENMLNFKRVFMVLVFLKKNILFS